MLKLPDGDMTVPENTSRLIGYARVSTTEQSLDMQLRELLRAGVDEANIYSETVSGAKARRPALAAALKGAVAGDTFVVWKLDRVGRNLLDLLHRLKDLEDRGIKFKSLTEGIDTATPGGKLILHVMASLAQFERDLVVERTRAGIKAYRERGGRVGPAPKLTSDDISEAKDMWKKGIDSNTIADRYKVSRQTIYRRVIWPLKASMKRKKQ